MSEVRTTSRTGGEKGVKDERYDLIPLEGEAAIARVFAFGATKYADHNWRRGYEWSKSYAALQRHIKAFWAGETNDPESGLPHLAHAGFHILVLLTWLEQQGEGGEFDDRYRPAEPEVSQVTINAPSIELTFENGELSPDSLRVLLGFDPSQDEQEVIDAMPTEEVEEWHAEDGVVIQPIFEAAKLRSWTTSSAATPRPVRFVAGVEATEDLNGYHNRG